MQSNYWIYENKVIFKPNFNDKLDNYFDIISKYNELIFSNYDNYNITIKTNNIYCDEYAQNNKKSIFNQQVNLPNIKYIGLDCNNIDLIENLPNSVKKISFHTTRIYNKELNCLPEFVEYIKLPISYDKKISKFSLNLKTIKCYRRYKYINDFKIKIL